MPLLDQATLAHSSRNSDENQARPASSSSNSRSSTLSSRQSASRRSQTPKVKRKTLSNRTAPYSPVPTSHSIRSSTSTINLENEREESHTNISQAPLNINFNALSMNTAVDHSLIQRIEPSLEKDPFEKSSEDDREVNHCEIVQLLCLFFLSLVQYI